MPTALPFLPMMRELVRCYQAFEKYSAAHVRSLGLTPSQFDIVATLGNTPGMTFRELGEKTLITKGTLTGVVDRLERKRLVERMPVAADGRCSIVRLTRAGQREFRRVFPDHLAHVGAALDRITPAQQEALRRSLARLRIALAEATDGAAPDEP